MDRPRLPLGIRLPVGLALAWLAVHQVHAMLASGGDESPLFHRDVHLVVLGIATAVAVAAIPHVPAGQRLGWALIAVGVGGWTFGEGFYTHVLWDDPSPPIPSAADAGYLLFPIAFVAGLGLLVRRHAHAIRGTLWADGLTVALAVSSVGTAVVLAPVLDHVEGRQLAAAIATAYPAADVMLLAVVAATLAGMGWRLDGRWVLLAAGILVFGVADSIYAIRAVAGTYESGGAFDGGWWLGLLLIGCAGWAPSRAAPTQDDEAMRLIAVPLTFGSVGLGVLLYGNFADVNDVALVLAASSIVAVMGRLMLTFRDNVAMLRRSREEATTDALTGLANRRGLAQALERELRDADDADPLVLVLFDLDGFKHYNDTFGHPAGDALLVRLGAKLAAYLDGRGQAFRMGGDEFCALFRPGRQVAAPLVDGAAAALAEHGEGFSIGCSWGSIVLPREATDALEALRIADDRMYVQKGGGRRSAERQSADVLLRVISERHPELGEHADDVADLAEATAVRLGLPVDETRSIRHAAELHDVGKVAIPDSILSKPAALDAAEWAFMRRHTLIGERILSAAPALAPVAALVRASHERWDGTGYPDGLAREDIPLGARVVAVADAFDAMVTDRAYSVARSPEAALAELRRCAGTQFDPVVVEAFAAVLAAGLHRPERVA